MQINLIVYTVHVIVTDIVHLVRKGRKKLRLLYYMYVAYDIVL